MWGLNTVCTAGHLGRTESSAGAGGSRPAAAPAFFFSTICRGATFNGTQIRARAALLDKCFRQKQTKKTYIIGLNEKF